MMFGQNVILWTHSVLNFKLLDNDPFFKPFGKIKIRSTGLKTGCKPLLLKLKLIKWLFMKKMLVDNDKFHQKFY